MNSYTQRRKAGELITGKSFLFSFPSKGLKVGQGALTRFQILKFFKDVDAGGHGIPFPFPASHRSGGGMSYLASGLSPDHVRAHMRLSLGTLEFYVNWSVKARLKSMKQMLLWAKNAYKRYKLTGVVPDRPDPKNIYLQLT